MSSFILFNSVDLSVAACLGLQCIPKGVWHCSNCNKFENGGNVVRPIVIRLTRVVKTPENEVGGCVFCRLVPGTISSLFYFANTDRWLYLCLWCIIKCWRMDCNP